MDNKIHVDKIFPMTDEKKQILKERGSEEIIAYLSFDIFVACPNCGEQVKVAPTDCDDHVTFLIFNNRWDELKGYEVKCNSCYHKFNLDKVEY